LYPLLFEPIYKEMIWGGRKLSDRYGRRLPSDHTGESWDISFRENEMGRVINGLLAGQSFAAVTGPIGGESRAKWLGPRFVNEEFPLLVKIIDANDNLSVQVHPGGAGRGKTEMWYVLDAPEDGKLIIGLKDGITKEAFAQAVNENGGQAVEGMLNNLPVKRGDIIYIPAGLIHAITKGVMTAEIQQNSDITYRVYDYGRKGLDGMPRQLHKEEALAVIDFENLHKKTATPGIKVNGTPFTYYIANQYFCVIGYDLDHMTHTEESDPDKFFIFTCVEGNCVIHAGDTATPLAESYSVFIPAALGRFSIESAHCKLLKSFVPEIDRDFYRPLLKAGYTKKEIYSKTAADFR
jgi:mannose-6-phosphate isomerase